LAASKRIRLGLAPGLRNLTPVGDSLTGQFTLGFSIGLRWNPAVPCDKVFTVSRSTRLGFGMNVEQL
jgi:hypothetical protein